ncbi:MAG: hypothetical protein WAV04_03820 [Candidatus Microsaccharimonas sp.]|jgi:hypothetical protein
MYSGTTIGKRSGHLIGVHQRIDRIARRKLATLPKTEHFPTIQQILHFEGNNGPDGIKRKSPSIDEPWHYINPEKFDDRSLIDMIIDHQVNLAQALTSKNEERAAFEAAWMAHAIVDGLTPAHHFPLGDKIEELFGIPHYERQTVKDKNIIKGVNRRDTLSKNWQYWGSRGVIMSHFWFEIGIAMSILGKRFSKVVIQAEDIDQLKNEGYEAVFRRILKEVFDLQAYEAYIKSGWDVRLARRVRLELIPLIVKAVTLGWYAGVMGIKR